MINNEIVKKIRIRFASLIPRLRGKKILRSVYRLTRATTLSLPYIITRHHAGRRADAEPDFQRNLRYLVNISISDRDLRLWFFIEFVRNRNSSIPLRKNAYSLEEGVISRR